MACRINYTSAWKLRLLYELSEWDSAMFLTLTYDDDHLPSDYGLHKKDLSGFFKRLRNQLEYYEQRRIKFYACGEYGSKEKRPHYHAIIFGLSPYDDKAREYIISAWQHRCTDWQFDRMRGKKCAIQPVCPEDIEYVTGYVQKKLSGDMASKEYGQREPPFALMSKGLGLDFALSNADRLRTNGFTYLGGHKISLPRYYRDKLEIDVDYTTCPKKTQEQMQEECNYLIKLFEEETHIKFYTSNPTEFNINVNRFDKWYERHREHMALQVYEDFAQRSRMRNGI